MMISVEESARQSFWYGVKQEEVAASARRSQFHGNLNGKKLAAI